MKKNYLFLLVGATALSLTGCKFIDNLFPKKSSNSSGEKSSSSMSQEEKTWVDESDYDYEYYLQKPSSIVSNIDDLKAITDYHAFYKDTDSFTVTLDDNYVFSSPQGTMESEMNYLYWYGELVNGAISFDSEEIDENTWKINYLYHNNASVDGHPSDSVYNDLGYHPHEQTRSNSYNDFATEEQRKTTVDVATTQQLWYAAEHGYRINTIPNSPAEYYYNLCKDVLREIVDDDMSEYQKTAAIYDYIEHNSTYCYEALDAMDSPDPVNYPDVVCSTYKAFFIEGFFDNHTVVCDGYSKIYTLLGRMEGLNIYRDSGTSDKGWTSKEVAGHAYCFVELDGLMYLSCPTWGQTNAGSFTVLNKNYFLSPLSFIEPYTPDDVSQYERPFANSTYNIPYFENNYFTYGGENYSLYVQNDSSFEAIGNALKSSYGFLNLYFASYNLLEDFIDSGYTSGLHGYVMNGNEVVLFTY